MEHLQQFKEWLDTHGIKLILIDLDDTVIDTFSVFNKHIEELYSYLVQNGHTEEEVRSLFKEYNEKAYDRYGVAPLPRWKDVTSQLQRHFGFSSTQAYHSLSILMRIYAETPRFLPGAKKFLKSIQPMEIAKGLITHANNPWTHFKLNELQLWPYFDWVYIVNEYKKKDTASWLDATYSHGFLPSQTLGGGDNVKGDVIAAHDAGFPYVFWLKPKRGWSKYLEGNIPEDTIEISRLDKLFEAVLERP